MFEPSSTYRSGQCPVCRFPPGPAGAMDTVVPTSAARAAVTVSRGPGETLRYPVDHFDVYADVWQPRLLADQIEFVTRNVGRRDHSVSVTA